MTKLPRNTLHQTVSLYLIICSIGLIIFFFNQMGIGGIRRAPISSAVSLLLLVYYLFSGVAGALKKSSKTAFYLICISLILQSLSIAINGLYFRNSFGPALSIAYSAATDLSLSFRLFAFSFSNGYEPGIKQLDIAVNILPLITLALLIYFKRVSNKISSFTQ
ncbi:MAG: hypothetical protein ABWZ25_15780 [Chitinophagaceae bacterium]